MEAASERAERGHDALHIHNHGIHGSCGHGQLLLQEVSGHRHAVAHEDLVSRAAHSGHVDAHGALLFGQLHQFRIYRRRHNHLRQKRLMAMHNDVDLIWLQYTQVGL